MGLTVRMNFMATLPAVSLNLMITRYPTECELLYHIVKFMTMLPAVSVGNDNPGCVAELG
jgi:hypothetical protein